MGNLAAFLGALLDSWRIRRLAKAEAHYIKRRDAAIGAVSTASVFRYWLLLQRERAAYNHWEHLLENTPRYWRVGLIAGGTFGLGKMTRARALSEIGKLNYQPRFIDDEHAFIAAGDPESDAFEQ